jgi:FKBP-type peptidyl-prolyl cis-trans isomerase
MFKHSTLLLCLTLLAANLVRPAPLIAQQEDAQQTMTAGPPDSKERVKPGSIDEDATAEFYATPSGLKYRILRQGGKTLPTPGDTVEVHYKGWLDNKTIFDSSYRRGEKISFALNRVIPGWTEGMQLIGEGGMIELEIPSKLGYGPRGMPPTIPPAATLHFVVELFDIK